MFLLPKTVSPLLSRLKDYRLMRSFSKLFLQRVGLLLVYQNPDNAIHSVWHRCWWSGSLPGTKLVRWKFQASGEGRVALTNARLPAIYSSAYYLSVVCCLSPWAFLRWIDLRFYGRGHKLNFLRVLTVCMEQGQTNPNKLIAFSLSNHPFDSINRITSFFSWITDACYPVIHPGLLPISCS